MISNYLQRKSLLNYFDKDCKKYLRRDFLHTCGYCCIREGDMGGAVNFQKDHFKPTSKGGLNSYDNLNYSCSTCNGKAGKSDYFSDTLLNPRKDDIWRDHIECDEHFVAIPKSFQGKEFINALGLNRRSYIKRRKTIAQSREQLKMQIQVLNELRVNANPTISSEIDKIIEQALKQIDFGVNSAFSFETSDDFEKIFCDEINKIGKCEEINGDYELLYKVLIKDREIYCYFIVKNFEFIDGKKEYEIKSEYLNAWSKFKNVAIVCYNESDSNFYWLNTRNVYSNKAGTKFLYSLSPTQAMPNVDFETLFCI